MRAAPPSRLGCGRNHTVGEGPSHTCAALLGWVCVLLTPSVDFRVQVLQLLNTDSYQRLSSGFWDCQPWLGPHHCPSCYEAPTSWAQQVLVSQLSSLQMATVQLSGLRLYKQSNKCPIMVRYVLSVLIPWRTLTNTLNSVVKQQEKRSAPGISSSSRHQHVLNHMCAHSRGKL